MKRIILSVFLSICAVYIFALDSKNGWLLPTSGEFRIFVVFAEIEDETLNYNIPGWSKGQMPDNPNSYIDAVVSQNYQSSISSYFSEISFGKLNVTGDYYPSLMKIPKSEQTYEGYSPVFNKLSTICSNGQQIQTARGLNFPNDFDLWTLTGSSGLIKQNVADNKIDCILIFWRENSKLMPTRGYGQFSPWSYYGINISGKSISTYGWVYSDDNTVFRHEFAHGIIGDNTFHSGGANSSYDRIYMQNYGGYSILSGWNRNNNSYNGWDRYRLGWKNAQKSYAISANSTSGQETAADLLYGQAFSSGDSAVYVLKNFATSGDAVRIKLPYVKSENTSAKEQWLWIENHQLLSGTVEYEDIKFGVNKQMYKVPKGIYMNIQVGNEDSSTYSGSGPNYISPINSFGNYDFTYSGDVASMSDQSANPFTGIGFASEHPVNSNGDESLFNLNNSKYYLEGKAYLTFNSNGVNMSSTNWASTGYYYLGSVYDAFYQGDKISQTTNPAPVPRMTFMTNVNTYSQSSLNLSPKNFDNRKIYLNGICVRVLEQMSNGDIKISVRWNDFKINKNVRWCGDIVLNEQIDVQPNTTVLLDQGLTPVRPTNPIVFNSEKIFASPTTFTCKSGSEIKVQSAGSVVLKNNSSITAQSGSTITIYSNANITIEAGSTLQIKSGANVNLSGSGKIIVKSGGYLCVESGASINLQDYNSLIVMEEGANYSANPLLFTSPSCSGSITKTGNGAIADFSQDVYIQNTTISASHYYGGKNIYVGNHVTTSQTGDVIINNGANVIFDCKTVTFDAGFECAGGSTYEVKNH